MSAMRDLSGFHYMSTRDRFREPFNKRFYLPIL